MAARDGERTRRQDAWVLGYVLTGVGGSLLMLCPFLPWVTVSVFGAQVSVDGLGHLSGLGGLLANVSVNASAGAEGGLVALLGLATVAAVGGAFLLRRTPSAHVLEPRLALAIAGLGALAAVDIVVELLTMGGNSGGQANGLLSSAAQLVGAGTTVSAGAGLYLGALGVLCTVVAGMLLLVGRQPSHL